MGTVASQNYEKAVELYMQAEEQSETLSQELLGEGYENDWALRLMRKSKVIL